MPHQIYINGTPVTYKGASGIKGFIVQMERQKRTHRTVKTVCINSLIITCAIHIQIKSKSMRDKVSQAPKETGPMMVTLTSC